MSPNPRILSDTELEVLKALWLADRAPVRTLVELLQTRGRDWAYTTVQTLLGRLADKGFVGSQKEGRAFVFFPLVSQEDLVGHHLDDLAQRMCEGSAAPLLVNLVRRGRLSQSDVSELKDLLDQLESADDADPRNGGAVRGS